MYTKDSETCAIDSISCSEMTLKQSPMERAPVIDLQMAYLNSKTGVTFGSCRVVHNASQLKEGILSPTTIEKLYAFLEAAEEDFGKLVFGQGRIIEAPQQELFDKEEDDGMTNRPPKIGLGGGR